MQYDKLLSTLSAIVDNPDIEKRGLVLEYNLTSDAHRKMHEQLFYTLKQYSELVYTDIFEVEVEGVLVRFVKNDNI